MRKLLPLAGDAPFPVEFTDLALEKMANVLEADPALDENFAVRVSCKGGGCGGISWELNFDNESFPGDFEKEFSSNNLSVKVVVDPHSAPYLKGVVVDYVKQGLTEGFKFKGGDEVKRTCGCGSSFSI